MPIVRNYLTYIADVVTNVVSATEGSYEEPSAYATHLREKTLPITNILTECKRKLLSAGVESQGLDSFARGSGVVKEFTARLPPLAFEIARETKMLVSRIEGLSDGGRVDGSGLGGEHDSEDFS